MSQDQSRSGLLGALFYLYKGLAVHENDRSSILGRVRLFVDALLVPARLATAFLISVTSFLNVSLALTALAAA
jgi:hypothetical protein